MTEFKLVFPDVEKVKKLLDEGRIDAASAGVSMMKDITSLLRANIIASLTAAYCARLGPKAGPPEETLEEVFGLFQRMRRELE